MGNRPKMSLKYAIVKIDIHVKQESVPPVLGIVGDKKCSPFLELGIPSPIFLHPKSLKMAVFGCKKMGLPDGDHFLSLTIPQNGGIDTFLGEIWANFENRAFLAHFWPISPYKIPK